jgi:hypothetical protein
MTTERTERAHPSDLELAAWVDEPASGAAAIRSHLERCAPCRERIAEFEATRAALALDPSMPSEAAFAAQRKRILTAIGATPISNRSRIAGRAAWIVPLAAAAAIAGFVLVGRVAEDRTDGPSIRGTSAEAGAPLPIIAEAADAAEEAAASIDPGEDPSPEPPALPAEAIDQELLDAVLAATEPLAPPFSVERSLTTEFLFAELPEDEQSDVLLEMASVDLEF